MTDDISALFNLPARFVVRIGTRSGERTELKIAIGYDQELLLTETHTPFEFEFTANSFTALMSLKESSEDISAEMWSDVYGEFEKIGGGSGGPTHKLMFSPSGPVYGLSGSAL
jgi:hypothetical protein